MQSMHYSRYAGHLGERQTLARVRSRFYSPGMSGDVHMHALCEEERHDEEQLKNKVLVEKYIAVCGDGDVPLVRHQDNTILSIPPTREWTGGEFQPETPRHCSSPGVSCRQL
ncbi:conserved hypothetical protein [Trichinella spiralis]|uniref:hypothetical protein n=1 Tax=Trichinella spiralis TaxID=6334 RepID=UPI0001EFCA29|nr:conserved hypothetical protein [Trichinella spiralis]